MWKTLNSLRVEVSSYKETIAKWGYSEDPGDIQCDSGNIQNECHLLVCPNIGTTCIYIAPTPAAIKVVEIWIDKI